ncbi:MAG: ADP-ribosylglycohydrolase family protein [Steroidobacteraceae bacterium]
MKRPLPNSYWVEPGRFLAGEHPDGGGKRDTRDRLGLLLAAGVRGFVDLTFPHEMTEYASLLPAGVEYANLPIVDHSIPDSPDQMRAVQDTIRRVMATGGAVYVHCRAGIGRTGTAVGCYLRESGAAPAEAVTQLNRLWKHNARAAHWPWIPETDEQEAYIRNWRVAGAGVAQAPAASVPSSPAARPVPRPAAARASSPAAYRHRGCLVGMAVGDACGSADAAAAAPLQWTDDTATALCVAQSLLASDGFNSRDLIERYRAFARDPTAIGAAAASTLRPGISDALTRAMRNRAAPPGSHDPGQADPSLLARSAAAALFAGGQLDLTVALAADVTRVTQQTAVAVDACRLFAAMVATALAGGSRQRIIATHGQLPGAALREEVLAVATGWTARQGGRRAAQRGLLGTLDRAVRCFIRAADFDSGLAAALAARGPDRDALGAAYGALAGTFYGDAGIGTALQARVSGLVAARDAAEDLYAYGSAASAPVA